ncbi:hypothetical protein H2200_003986 [Cladophialophora chaetospira]|uniref:Uncharacterized protein n=1 Tax=Cladophialophora chaetospira TaxID=386627 RepID=A0AA38XFB8_9EURO|nr:hypothetical protein H2200_003986 [Cladophialophora chaetospira]
MPLPPQSRDPIDYSPATSSFLSSTSNPTVSGPVRRNLFSTHLSRRPASGAQPPQLDGPSEQHASQSHSYTHQQQHGTDMRRLQTHRRSASTPSLSPSPPRLSPFHNAPNDSSNAAYIPPPIPLLSPQRAALADGYDPTISPNRPLSPRSSAALFPNQSIIALNPLTGRPVLPKLPALPARLRLTDSDDEMNDEPDEDEGEEDDEEIEIHDPHAAQGEDFSDDDEFHNPTLQAYTRRRGARGPPHPNPYSHEHGGHHDPSSPAPRAEHTDAGALPTSQTISATSPLHSRARIERLLSEMMTRQRLRANASTKAPVPSSSTVPIPVEDEDDEEATEEKEELMGLIMGSLRKEVARAEEEGWMYGDGVGSGGMVGRDELGVYD